MNTQVQSNAAGVALQTPITLRPGRVLRLGSAGGRLDVLHGRVWLTRAGDRDDHVVRRGESFSVPSSGRVLVETFDDDRPALVAWRSRSLAERMAAALHASVGRCWEVVDPPRRIAAGVAAAVVALAAGALLFGPLSDARTRSLAGGALLHNSAAPEARLGADGRSIPRGTRADAGAEPRDRPHSAAREAHRRAPGVA